MLSRSLCALAASACVWSATVPPLRAQPPAAPAHRVSGAIEHSRLEPTRVSGFAGKPRAAAWKPGDPIREIPRRAHWRPPAPVAPRAQEGTDPLALRQQALAQRRTVVPDTELDKLRDFAGQGYTGVNPPDTVGAIGPSHFVQMINGPDGTAVAIYDRTGTVAGTFSLSSLAPDGHECDVNALGDPIVLYDQLAGRWFLGEFTFNDSLCMYVSLTDDALTTGWNFYEFTPTEFPDYPKWSVWPDAYYLSTNESSAPRVYALDRAAMLSGTPTTVVGFAASSLGGFGFQALTPTSVDGATSPPAGTPGIFSRHRDDEAHNPGSPNPAADFIELFEFDVDFTTPASSTFTALPQIAITEFDSDLCGLFVFNCIVQPGTSTRLDPLREVVMFRFIYRNFGTHESLLGNLATDVTGGDVAGVRWFELRDTGLGFALHDEGTFSPDTDASRWMGSSAMDFDGNIAVGFNTSGAATHPQLDFAGRLTADAAGTLPHTGQIVDGTASNASIRYGDYSSMSVDPRDDCTFWFTGEYNAAATWSTRVAALRFDTCRSLLLDGFESGDTSAWSLTSGGGG